MSIIYPIHKAPYTNFHDLNLDWIIDTLNDFNDRLTNFVSHHQVRKSYPVGHYQPVRGQHRSGR